jgi:RsiW-degrading membrane proteinase PrsW (M82 family)
MADQKIQVSQSESSEDLMSPRRKGMRQGVMLMLLSIVLIPAYVLLVPLFPANDRFVESSVSDTPFEKISQALLFTIFIFGLARVLFAYFFQQGARSAAGDPEIDQFGNSYAPPALSEAQSIPVSGFGAWRADSAEILESPSAKEQTTDAKPFGDS